MENGKRDEEILCIFLSEVEKKEDNENTKIN